jgi:hypothetical protein
MKTIATIVLVAAAISLTGCGAGGYQQADRTITEMKGLRAELTDSRDQLEKTLVALNEVVSAAESDPRPAYELFAQEFEQARIRAGQIRKRAQQVRAQSQAYFRAWQADSAKVTRPALKSGFERRKKKLEAQCEEIDKHADLVMTEYDILMKDLRDIQLVLGTDLSTDSIELTKYYVSEASKDAKTVSRQINAYIAILDETAEDMSPTTQ